MAETMREGLARALCCAAAGDQSPSPVPDELMPRSWASECGQWRAAADAALSYLASRGGLPGVMPRYFGIWSATGVHIGVWEDGKIAADVLAEYPGGKIIEMVAVEVAEIAQAAALKKVTAERDALREALEFYADEVMAYTITQYAEPRSAVHADRGKRARAALSRDADEIREAGE